MYKKVWIDVNENSFTTKVGEYIPSDFSMFKLSSFKSIKISVMYIEVKIA